MSSETKLNSDMYRKSKSCNNCPFLDNGKKIRLNNGRVNDIKEMLLNDNASSFNCHKTVYSLDEDMNTTEKQELKMCYGAYKFLKENDSPNIQMKLALSMGLKEL
ncbi:hypothetical protein [Poseidonibacter ostreae]|uniref:Uncharacterized protein n=1 Tax=Poseidonibacter ostreae TaxID=2654171 RepID=A0A6L4WWE0_9BACT|nr:hypothetical protein [Poseidonibacter ostreae]KAB7891346.1 hypothetical protein GBG19_00485 [Poseidonibacter ostreae]